ncbi:MAG: cobyrinate a,c-diamide synthase, partial [Acidimicrobiales bacterium]
AGCRIGVATGRAFSFTYTDTLDALRAAGAEVVAFDPMSDATLPEGLGGLIVGGGFPEVHVAELSRNRRMLDDIARLVGAGLPTWAECGGLMLLCGSLDGHAMAGVIDADAEMSGRLTLGYREVVTRRQSPVGAAGTAFRGHEFHYSSVIPAGDALALHSRWGDYLEGWASPSLLATYVHHHPGGDPSLIAAFASTCARHKRPAP